MDPKAIKELVAFGKEELLDAKGLDVFGEATDGEVEQVEVVESEGERDSMITASLYICK